MDKGISHVLSMSILLYGLQRPIFNSQDKEPYSFVGLKAQEKTGLLLMPTAKVTKNVSAAEGGGNVLCSILISIKTKAWLYSFRSMRSNDMVLPFSIFIGFPPFSTSRVRIVPGCWCDLKNNPPFMSEE